MEPSIEEKQENVKIYCSKRHITDEEFQNFMQRVTEVGELRKEYEKFILN